MPKFDSETYEQQKQKAKMGGGYSAVLERMLEDVRSKRAAEEAFDPETGLPKLPTEPCPFEEGVPGLPPYRIVEEPEPVPQIFYAAEAMHGRNNVDKAVDDFLSEINNNT